jgi:hypothetical protein
MSSSEQALPTNRRCGLAFTRREVLAAGGAALLSLPLRGSSDELKRTA